MSQIQHTVLFRLPALSPPIRWPRASTWSLSSTTSLVSRRRLPRLECPMARRVLAGGDGRRADWPDKTTGYSHGLLVIAATCPPKAYLHSELHSQWAAPSSPVLTARLSPTLRSRSVFSPGPFSWPHCLTQLGLPPPTCVRSERFHCRGGRRRQDTAHRALQAGSLGRIRARDGDHRQVQRSPWHPGLVLRGRRR